MAANCRIKLICTPMLCGGYFQFQKDRLFACHVFALAIHSAVIGFIEHLAFLKDAFNEIVAHFKASANIIRRANY